MQKVLIANRGEIAVRVARACKDAGLTSVAVYAEPDRDALHVRIADEAFALGGTTPGDSYLVIDKILDAAKQSGADAVHPGYGFLSENADFAQAVIDAGLTWIGPSPEAILALGDKVRRGTSPQGRRAAGARHRGPGEGRRRGRRLRRGARPAGRHQGGVRRRRARPEGGPHHEEIPELFDSAVREAVAAFGRGECFVERFLDQPRHVEAQVLADTHGNVVVVGTRDCSLQRRNQKLVEEAPAPFLTDEQRARIHESAKAICAEAGYHGAGTVEYLVGADGSISFLEVNTRLQVEHPVTEETSGIDLVRQQFRIADGLRAGDHRGPGAARARHRVPDQRRGRRPQLPARPRPGARGWRSRRARASASTPASSRRRGRRRLRLDAGQAHRHRRHPRGGAAARPPGPGRDHRRGHADGAPVPPRGRPRRGLHQRAVHRAHPLDRDRVGQRGPAVRRGPGRAAEEAPAADRRRRGRRTAPGGVPPRRAGRRRRAPRVRPRSRASAAAGSGLGRLRRLPDLADAGHDRQGRGRGRRDRRGGRPDRRARGDEDGAADRRPQGGTVSGLSADVGAAVTSGAVICTIADAAE